MPHGSGKEVQHAAVAKRLSLLPAVKGGEGGSGSSAGSSSTAVVGPEEGSAVGPSLAAAGGRWMGCRNAGRATLG